MNTNTLCLRVFFVLSLLLLGAALVFLYGKRIITPFALAWLPTQTAEARYANPYVLLETPGPQGKVRLYRSAIEYNGITATLFSTTAPTSLDPVEPLSSKGFLAGLKQSPPSVPANEPKKTTFVVRYVSSAPTLVARDIPAPGLGNWIGETWSVHDLGLLAPLILFFAVLAYAFRRHLKSARWDRDIDELRARR